MTINRSFQEFTESYDIFKAFPENRHQYPEDITTSNKKKEYFVINAINISDAKVLENKPDSRGIQENALVETIGEKRKNQRNPGDQRATLKSQATFVLPMPNIITDQLNHNWGEKEGIINASGKSFLGAAAEEALTGVKKKITQNFVPQSVLAKGQSIDKKTAILFDVTERRQFSFLFEMVPRTEKECKEIIAIYRKLRYYSSSEAITKGTVSFFKYPEVFRIGFFRNGQLNENLPKIDTCALVSIDMNFTPDSIFSQYSNGFPPNVRMTLSFKELNIMTKEFIRAGY